MALLYASAYYMPLLTVSESYFIPAFDTYVFWPVVAAAGVIAPLIIFTTTVIRSAAVVRPLVVLGATLLTVIATKSAIEAADYSWVTLMLTIIKPAANLAELRVLKLITMTTLSVAAFLVLWYNRNRLSGWLRWLSILGYAFLVLAVFRTFQYRSAGETWQAQRAPIRTDAAEMKVSEGRRVLWVIFDELDYNLSLAEGAAIRSRLENFTQLSARAVSAEKAYSPAKDSASSIPALLLGTPISGFERHGPARLTVRSALDQRIERRFSEADSIFARLPSGPKSASIVGYYHPYCSLFPSVGSCRSFYLGNAGRWFDALTFFSGAIFSAGRWVDGFVDVVPEFFWRHFDVMYRISQSTIEALPGAVGRHGQALVFLHVNLPHVPGSYAQKALRMPQTADDHEVYAQNLVAADQVLGKVLGILQKQPDARRTLLIVSSDHWYRLTSPMQAQPIPFIAWLVGEENGQSISHPISTVYTSDLVLDFLIGTVDTPDDIARWWVGKPFHPTWLPH